MIDIIRKYKTRSGRNVVILAVDIPGSQPVVGYCEDAIGDIPFVGKWCMDGSYHAPALCDCCDKVHSKKSAMDLEAVNE